MNTFNRTFILMLITGSVLQLNSCQDSGNGPKQTFNSAERFVDKINIPAGISTVNINNPIGFIFINGSADSVNSIYVLDRSVTADDRGTADVLKKTIILDNQVRADTLSCSISYPYDLRNVYECNLNLDVFYKRNINIKKPNQGVQLMYLNSDIYAESESWNITADKHTGSLDLQTTNGHIFADVSLPVNGYCKCYSLNGHIFLKIPKTSSALLNIKTSSGTINLSNLEIITSKKNKYELSGILGDGEASISLYSRAGKITVEGY